MRDEEVAETQLASEPPASAPEAREQGASPFDPPPPERRFVETDELGRGGMGRVFEAHDEALDRRVAIKQSLGSEPALLARFEREVRITAKLQHPNIVPVLDAGRDGFGRPYYVMRRIEGRPLADLIAKTTTLEQRIALIPHVLAAVDACAYAHARGVIHRDIKPWNVLVGPFGETLLIDWGLARELDDDTVEVADSVRGSVARDRDLTRAGETYGTPGFMAPEQARGESLDRRADVYALGATLLHTLTGSRPVADVDPGSALPPALPRELVAIVDKAMARTRSARYADAGALAEDLRRFTTGQLVAAHHYTARELIGRWLRRHRLAVGVAVLALIVVGVGATIAVQRVVAARDQAAAAAAGEARRADEVVLEHAQSLLPTDATLAVALLRELHTDDPGIWARASAVFDSALARGVARGRFAHPGASLARVSASPDQDVVASVANTGEVMLHDPALREARRIASIPDAANVWWLDASHLLVMDRKGDLFLVGLDGVARQVARDLRSVIGIVRGRAFAITATRQLIEVDVGDGTRFEPISDVNDAVRLGDAVIYSNWSAVMFRTDGRPTEVLTPFAAESVVSSGDRQRVAFSSRTQIIEWDTSGARPVERGRWPFTPYNVMYVGHALYAQDAERNTWLRPDGHSSSTTGPLGPAATRAVGDPCSFIAVESGGVWEICTSDHSQLSTRTEKLTSLAIAGSHVIGATATGRLLSWDRSHGPRRVRGSRRMTPTLFSSGKLWSESGALMVMDLATGETAERGLGSFRCHGVRFAVEQDLLDADAGALFALDLATEQRVSFARKSVTVSCSRQDTVAVADGKRITLRALSNPTVVVDTVELDREVQSLHHDGSWLVVSSPGVARPILTRIDLRTKARTELPDALEGWFAVDGDGRVLIAGERSVLLWNPDGTQVVLPIAGAIRVVVNPVGFVLPTRDRSLAVVRKDQTLRTFKQGAGFAPSVAATAPYALISGFDGEITIVDLRDGRMRVFSSRASGAQIAIDGTQLAAWNSTVMVWDVPRDRSRSELEAALGEATNATLDQTGMRAAFPDHR